VFDAVARRKRTPVCISISRPYDTGKDAWACLFVFSGIEEEEEKTEILGVDALQAMILNLSWLRHLLARLRKKGYEFYETGSRERFMVERYFDTFTRDA
jgi:hypothetical protein